MLNFSGNEDLCKLGKKYLNDLLCKFGTFCPQHSKTFDISHAFLQVTVAELSTLKQVQVFLAHPVHGWVTVHIDRQTISSNHSDQRGLPFLQDRLTSTWLE